MSHLHWYSFSALGCQRRHRRAWLGAGEYCEILYGQFWYLTCLIPVLVHRQGRQCRRRTLNTQHLTTSCQLEQHISNDAHTYRRILGVGLPLQSRRADGCFIISNLAHVERIPYGCTVSAEFIKDGYDGYLDMLLSSVPHFSTTTRISPRNYAGVTSTTDALRFM